MAKTKNTELQVPNGKHPIWPIYKFIIRCVHRHKPKIINLAGELTKESIVVANHSAMSGPPVLELYYPHTTCKWGAHEMFGNHKSRTDYLRDVLYIQKKHMKPGFITSAKAWIIGWLNPIAYKGMRNLPTYTDGRLGKTIKTSIKAIDQGYPVMIFPENSNEGYFDVLTEFFPGFVMLAQRYFVEKGKDIPVYPTYISVSKHILVIGEPIYCQDLVKQGMNRYQIANVFKDKVNELYFNYVKDAEVYYAKKDKKQK
ncbi:MAG: 1-acyl-sn-glycerol-3-phosphate acyltransferase [Clostridia bacterium]|nr:1-acyl-sn-glycerol-3-phosphate acyltransferase [Clostridia bacterium]